MSTLRYIAYLAEDPAKLVEFYHRFLGTEELGRSPEGDITITDGFYNLTFFKKRPALGEMHMDTGLHHIGLQVDDLEEVKGRFLKLYPRGMIIQEANDLHHGEIRLHDPECRPVTVSTQEFRRAGRAKKKYFRACVISPIMRSTRKRCCFFTRKFSACGKSRRAIMRRQQGRGNRFCADGKTNLAIHPFTTDRRSRSEVRHQPHRFSHRRNARDHGRAQQRLEYCAAPFDPPLRRISLS